MLVGAVVGLAAAGVSHVLHLGEHSFLFRLVEDGNFPLATIILVSELFGSYDLLVPPMFVDESSRSRMCDRLTQQQVFAAYNAELVRRKLDAAMPAEDMNLTSARP